MTPESMWKILNAAAAEAGSDEDLALDLVQAALEDLPEEELAGFAGTFEAQRDLLFTMPIWGAMYLVNGEATDEGLMDFAAWIMLQGQKVYDDARANPDSLAGIIDAARDDYGFVTGEQLSYLSYAIYEEKTGKELPFATAHNLASDAFAEEFDFDDPAEMQKRYPKLWTKLGGFRQSDLHDAVDNQDDD
jgi:hypothetical protein